MYHFCRRLLGTQNPRLLRDASPASSGVSAPSYDERTRVAMHVSVKNILPLQGHAVQAT
jgi:hypothetical protein